MDKSDKMRVLPKILYLFRNEFNKFNNTVVRIFDSFNHMTIKSLQNRILERQLKYLQYVVQCYNGRHYVMVTTSVLSILLHRVIYHSQTQSHVIKRSKRVWIHALQINSWHR